MRQTFKQTETWFLNMMKLLPPPPNGRYSMRKHLLYNRLQWDLSLIDIGFNKLNLFI